jgi:hypothetical protein
MGLAIPFFEQFFYIFDFLQTFELARESQRALARYFPFLAPPGCCVLELREWRGVVCALISQSSNIRTLYLFETQIR